METGTKVLNETLNEMRELKLNAMADKLQALYEAPEFVSCDRLQLISDLIGEEFESAMKKRYANRLKSGKFIGTPCELDKCIDSKDRKYEPFGIVRTLATLDFVEKGMNLCIFGASDSGKTYLAKALGANACQKYHVEYYRCEELLEDLASLKEINFQKYKRRINHLIRLELLILDDFLLHSISDEEQKKVLYEVLEKRNELSRSCIICSQREPKAWTVMLLQDEVSSNSLLKRVTKHYNVAITTGEKA